MDDLFTPSTPPNPAAPGPRPCGHPRRHREVLVTETGRVVRCGRCGHAFDPSRVAAGRRGRRKGIRGELRSRDRYGWTKVGERGGITDLRGTLMKVQQKTSGGLAPVRWRSIFRELDTVRDGRIAAILLSFVRQGVAADDYIIIRGADWLALHGVDQPEGGTEG